MTSPYRVPAHIEAGVPDDVDVARAREPAPHVGLVIEGPDPDVITRLVQGELPEGFRVRFERHPLGYLMRLAYLRTFVVEREVYVHTGVVGAELGRVLRDAVDDATREIDAMVGAGP